MRTVLVAILLAGCTLYDSRGGSGGDDDGSGGGDSPVGHSFAVSRTIVGGESCGFFEETISVGIDVVSTSAVNVSAGPASSVSVRTVPAREGAGDPPNVTFKVSEQWEGNGPANPTLDYLLWIDATLITGRATTSFQHVSDGTPRTCSYAWVLSQL